MDDLHEDGTTEIKITEPSADKPDKLGLLYSISDTPPWYLCILLGLQVSQSDS